MLALNFKVEPINDCPANPVVKLDWSSGSRLSKRVENILSRQSILPFKITWKGSKVPHGGIFNGSVIAWAQSGRILNSEGRLIGTYRRIREFDGPNRDLHEIEAWTAFKE